jgi:hypothetical protein
MSIITAWQHISPQVSVKGCKDACISTALDESDDDMLWNDGKNVGNIRSECEGEGTDCEDGDSDTD